MRLKKCGELSYVIGLVCISFATALMAKSGFGLSMVVAPAYVLADAIPFLTVGRCCYIIQGILLVTIVILNRRFQPSYLLAFLSAFLFGSMVDFCTNIILVGIISPTLGQRIVYFCSGELINSLAIALFFHTYLPPQTPELFVREVSRKCGWKAYRMKYVYDLFSCAIAIILSFCLLGGLHHVGIGTVACALCNAPLIGLWGRLLDRIADYDAAIPQLARWLQKY